MAAYLRLDAELDTEAAALHALPLVRLGGHLALREREGGQGHRVRRVLKERQQPRGDDAEPAVVHPSYFYQGARPYVSAPAREPRVDSFLKEKAGSQELHKQPCAEATTSEPAADIDVLRV